MSHLEYFIQQQEEFGLDYSVAALEASLNSFMLLMYGESPDFEKDLSINERILRVANIIEGLG
jgi:hypothetical protein